MEYRDLYKNASRGNRLKEGNSRIMKSKRESSRQELHFTNRNLVASDHENDENEILPSKPQIRLSSSGKKKRRSHRDDENKENDFRAKYEDRLARLRKYREEKAKAKQNTIKVKPFISAAPKNVIDREYEKNLFKKSEDELKKLSEKRRHLTPAGKHATPKVDTRRKRDQVPRTEDKQPPKRTIMSLKTPASIKNAKSKIDTRRKEGVEPNPACKGQHKIVNTNTVTKTKTVTATKSTTRAAAVSTNKKGMTVELAPGCTGTKKYLDVRSGQKSTGFNFKFNNDGEMVTSTNRKRSKDLEKKRRGKGPDQLELYRFSPKEHAKDDLFEGISPIDLDTPTPKKVVKDTDAFTMGKREARRRSMIFTVEDIKPREVKQEQQDDEWEPQVIVLSDDDSLGEFGVKEEPKEEVQDQRKMNESYTVAIKQEETVDRRPTFEARTPVKVYSPRLIGSGRKSLGARPSLIFVEEYSNDTVSVENPVMDRAKIVTGRASLVFFEEKNVHPEIATIEVFDSPIKTGTASPSCRLSGTPKMGFLEQDIPHSRPLPESNLATLLLNKQESKRRSSGGNRRSSLNSFREEDQPPTDVREKVVFYHNLVEKELKRLQELCNLYQSDSENDAIGENSRGLIIAAQGQTNILINKKLSKFKELVGHYELNWSDQKVRSDDLDGFWLMVSLDLENLDRRFEELRLLKENGWQEVIEQPKVKKLQGGGGIKKREKKPMKTKASGLADLIKKAREEAKKKKMMETALTETVTVVTPIKRSVRIATTPRRSSITRNSICAGCTPTSAKNMGTKMSRKTIFNDHTLRQKEIVKSILKTPSEKRRPKSVLFLDSGLDTPEARHSSSGGRKIVHTPKPKITFKEELEVENVETISLTTPYKLDEEIRRRRRSSLFPVEQQVEEVQQSPRRRLEEDHEREETRDQFSSTMELANVRKAKTRVRNKERVSFA
ncbi:uncharacterized protein LOC129770614 [Toxorhynchites rutilus septentrionalis]|uniref:uncharacterized protein LOC129770614 n=1 Tax=Toxorhynchites rutilus septentrionalis TaxID=329112 RepID=UPI002478D7B4|nr:uncharacterized protein LOC129770614 [Toxorhynchites rutilus septentrionalis]